MRRVSVLVMLGFIAASCASARTDVRSTQSDQIDQLPAVEQIDTLPAFDVTDEPVAPTDAADFDGAPYTFTIDLDVAEIDQTVSVSGQIAPATDVAVIEGLARSAVFTGYDDDVNEAIDADLITTQVHQDGESYARGLVPQMGYSESIDPDSWYLATPWTADFEEADILGATRSIEELIALLDEIDVPFETRDLVGGGSLLVIVPGEVEADLLRESGSVFEFAPYGDTFLYTLEADETGHLSSIRLDVDRGATVMRIDIADVGRPIRVPRVIDPVEPPSNTPTIDVDDLDDILDPEFAESPIDQVAPLRISTTGGFRVPGAVDRTYVVEADGDVLRIVSGNIYTGPSGYTTWNIGEVGRRAIEVLVEELMTTQANDAGENGPAGDRGLHGTVIGASTFFQVDHLERGDDLTATAAAFLSLLDVLDDPVALVGDLATEPRPWVPNRLAVVVGDDYNPQYYSTDDIVWPFDRTMDDMAEVTADDGSKFICLAGDDAAIAWHALLIDGVNNARLPVTDGVTTREVGLRISYPSYHVYGNSCPPLADIAGGSQLDLGDSPNGDSSDPAPGAALPVELVDELLLRPADLDGLWSQTSIQSVGPPPQLNGCLGATDRSSSRATARFDRWIERTITMTGADGIELVQFVGESNPGDDVDAIVDAIGPYTDCDQPLTELGITDFTSGDLDVTAPNVTAASYWTYSTSAGRYEVVADIAIDSRYVLVLGLSADDPLPLAALDPYIALAAEQLADLRVAEAACADADPVPTGRCG